MDEKKTTRAIPIYIAGDKEYTMALVDIFRQSDSVRIQFRLNGKNNQLLAEFLEQAEPIALTFGAIPVQNTREKREKN